MSIPQRFYRIARYKLNELKTRLDEMDDEAQLELEAEQQRLRERKSARNELYDVSAMPEAASRPAPGTANGTAETSYTPPPRLRTPEEIARGNRSGTVAASGTAASVVSQSNVPQSDELMYHYRLLGVDAGSDFATVQAAYSRLAARCDPSRFPAGSQEEREAQQILDRLEASFKVLREALDPMSRRFELIEFDTPTTM